MYISTRNNYPKVSASQAIMLGMVPEGGLFVPQEIPKMGREELKSLTTSTYQELAEKIMTLFLDDFSAEEIRSCVAEAYNENNFLHPGITPLQQLNDHTYILELWHGPTAAFKDLALQMLPHLLTKAIEKNGLTQETVILVATSGDTGKAALEGFKDVPGIKIIVFYPAQGVSKVQELQMVTTEGHNTHVVAIEGNFDDCQTAVKQIFANPKLNQLLKRNGYAFSSANSINWGRLLPQIIYYFRAYLQLVDQQQLDFGQKVNFVVPTGNFGNILAAWYASQMGLPIHKLLCASNENKVLTDFFQTGIYDRHREFKQTNSPSMDILVSSNLERFLFALAEDGHLIAQWMNDLAQKGKFKINTKVQQALKEIIFADHVNNLDTLDEIRATYQETGYIVDTHTAVALRVYKKYLAQTKDLTPTVIDATASPFKFGTSVLEALQGAEGVENKDEFQVLQELSELGNQDIHPGLIDLDKKEIRHNLLVVPGEIPVIILDLLQIEVDD